MKSFAPVCDWLAPFLAGAEVPVDGAAVAAATAGAAGKRAVHLCRRGRQQRLHGHGRHRADVPPPALNIRRSATAAGKYVLTYTPSPFDP